MRILHVSTTDRAGGAEKLALELFQMARAAGHEAVLAVGRIQTEEDGIVSISNDQYRKPWPKYWRTHQRQLQVKGSPRLARLAGWLANLGEPVRWVEWHLGYEDFNYPGTAHLFERLPFNPDIVHLHNLHGSYFDLRALQWITRRYPVVLTLHDEWALTGHCAYTFDCQRWQAQCGQCPNLSTYPALKRDATSHNLRRKREIYADSRLHVTAGSQWLIDRARKSILGPALIESRVIPYGIDLTTFKPADQQSVRRELQIPAEALVVLFVANRAVSNEYKDYRMLEESIRIVSEAHLDRPLFFIAVGEEAPDKLVGSAVLRRYGYRKSSREIALFYQAADLYVHAARAEAFGLVLVEAMACGLPVVATAVGGIPEVVDDQVTGYLVPQGDSTQMAARILTLLSDPSRRLRMGANGQAKATQRYDRERHFSDYLDWYGRIIESTRMIDNR